MPPETDNLKLLDLFDADQADRKKVYKDQEAVRGLERRDEKRRAAVLEMAAAGDVSTSNDLYRAGVILLHGAQAPDYLTAHRWAVIAAINGHRPARWLAAAALDRFLMTAGRPQVYGTQFERSEEEDRYQVRLPIDDSTLLAFEKQFFDVPALAERLAQLNGRISAK